MQNDKLSHEMIAVARTQLGVREATGRNDGAHVREYQNFIGGGLHGAPWCAAFASWCIHGAAKRCGVTPRLPKSASSQEIFNWARHHGALLSHPIPGCIGLIKGGGGHDHTFMVESVDVHAGLVHGIDGNWGNCVMRTSHPIRRCSFVAVA